MDNEITKQEQNKFSRFFNQSSNRLLIASCFVFIGFFLPWDSLDKDFENGFSIISNWWNLIFNGELNGVYKQLQWLIILYLLLLLSIPFCSLIIGYCSYKNKLSEKKLAVCVSLSTLLPFYFFIIYMFVPVTIYFFGPKDLGIGVLMMCIGSIYYLFYINSSVTF